MQSLKALKRWPTQHTIKYQNNQLQPLCITQVMLPTVINVSQRFIGLPK